MDYDQVVTFAVLGGALLLFVTEWLPVDVTALLIPVCLGLFGVLTPEEALKGFGNPAVVTVAGMFVLSRALVASGAVGALGGVLQRIARGGQRRALLAMCAVTAVCSAFMNNTPVVVVFLPLVLAVAGDLGVAPSRFLIPLSYATILGGCCTVIGTSTTVLVSGELARREMEPLRFFEPLPFGVAALVVGSLYIVLLGPRWLPIRRTAAGLGPERVSEYVTEVTVRPGSPLAGRTLREAFAEPHPGLTLLEVVRGEEILWPRDDTTLRPGDLVLLRGPAESLVSADLGAQLAGSAVRGRDVTLVELVIARNSPLVGRTVRDATRRALPGAAVMAVERRGSHLRAGVAELELREGDTLLVQTEKSRIEELRDGEDFVKLEGVHERVMLKRRAPLVLAVALSLVLAASFELVDIAFLAVGAALCLVLSGALTLRSAYRALDMPTLVLMAATVSIGVALDKSGGARLVADQIRAAAERLAPDGLQAYAGLAACYLLANLFTAFASNAAAAFLVLPIAFETAARLGVSDRPFILAIVYAASLDFSTPTGYQTNLLVYGPGGYRFSDYVRFGLPLNVLLALLAVLLIPLFHPFLPT